MHALRDGIRRVGKAPAVVLGVYVITLLTAAPLGIIMHGVIATDLGGSVAADDAAVGVNWEWWEEFQSHATGVARTFNPRILGFAAVLHNQSNFVDNQLPRGEVLLAVVAYLGIWTFLVGGIIDRLARQRRIASVGFFATCGTFFFRFCRLGLLAGIAYWIAFGMVHVWLFEDLYDLATENLAVERTAFLIRIALYGTFALLLLPINMVFDYAKVRGRRRGPPQRGRCRTGGGQVHSETATRDGRPLSAQRRSLSRRAGSVRGSGTEPRQRRPVDLDRLRRWSSVRGRETVHEIGVLRIPDCVFPESAGPFGVRRHPDCRLARLARG